MKKVLFLFLVLAFGFPQLLKAQDAENPFVHCIVLDKTMSMTGHGGTDIWADVQNYCYEWIDGVPQPSKVLFFTFDRKLYGPQQFEINSAKDKAKVKEAVKNVKVDGRFTYISSNLGEAIDYVYEKYPKASYNNRFYLITDGIEEEIGSDFASVMQKYSGKRGDYDYLFYVDLRDLATDEIREAIKNTEGTGIGTGFAKSLTVSPAFETVGYTIGESKSIVQQFVVSDEELFSGISFTVKVDSIVNMGTDDVNFNVVLTPSMVSAKDMRKIEEGRFEIDFSMGIHNGTLCKCNIYVSLSSRSQSDLIVDFEPNVFCIKARNKSGGKVRVTNLLVGICYSAVSKDLHQGEKLVKSIMELEFDEQAKAVNAYVTWELVGDWDKFVYSFSQGSLNGNALTINANEYKDFVDGNEGIALFLQGKPKTDEGNYHLSMKVRDVSDDLDFEKDDLNLDMNINYLLPPPTPLWIKLLIAGAILFVLLLLILLVLHVTAKFPKGILQLGHNEVRLKGKKRISVKDELVKLGVTLPEGTDVVFVKKRFASFQGPCLKETKNCSLNRYGSSFSNGSVIRPDEEIKGLMSIDGKEIIIRYCI